MSISGQGPEHWREERQRYAVLQLMYERTGARCEVALTGPEIGAALGLTFEDLFRLTYWLEDRGYIIHLGTGPRTCLSPKGIRYIEELAGHRRTIRE